MDRRTKNVEIFKDSIELMNGSSRLQQAIKESVNKQKLYLETKDVAVPESKGIGCKTVVSTKRSFEAAAVYARAFKAVQEKYASYFDTIEYAIFCGGHETQNYDAFCEVFGVEIR